MIHDSVLSEFMIDIDIGTVQGQEYWAFSAWYVHSGLFLGVLFMKGGGRERAYVLLIVLLGILA